MSVLHSQKLNFPFGPVWVDNKQSVYFVDLIAEDRLVYRYSFDSGILYSASIPGIKAISFIYPVRQKCKKCNDIFAIGMAHGVNFIKWDGKTTVAQLVNQTNLFNVEENDTKSIMDIAQADRNGRLYFGTYSSDFCSSPANSSFYRYSANRGVERIFGDLYGTSGIAIDEKAKKLYHSDYCLLLITEFDFNPKTGDLCK